MTELISIPAEEWARQQARCKALALEKSYLQLVNAMMRELSAVPGLENTAEKIVRLIVLHLGGTNVLLYYQVQTRFHRTDLYGTREMEAVDDPMVRAAFVGRGFQEELRDFGETQMATPAFTKASYWALPLASGGNVVGVLKTEGMLLSAAEVRRQLEPFFNYAALVLKNEIDGHVRLWEAARLAAIVQSSDEAIIGKDLEGIITSWNAGAERIYGYTAAEVAGRSIAVLLPQGREDEIPRILAQLRAGQHVRHFETVRRRKDGQEIHVSLALSPIHNAAGAIVGVSTIARDITERKRAEDALRGALAEVSDLYDHAPCGYHSLDKHGVFARINATELEWLGYGPEEVVGRMRFSDVLTVESRRTFQENFLRFKAVGAIRDLEFDLIRKDGSLLPVLLSATAVVDSRGDYLMSRSTVFDLTERKRADRQRQVHFRLLETMDRINLALHGSNDLNQTMSDVLDVVRSSFACDRAFLLYPCDPEAATWRCPMERCDATYPGVLALGLEMPMDSEVAATLRLLLSADGPLTFGPGTPHPLPAGVAERFGFKSLLSMALHPKVGKPWQFGIHQCSHVRAWTEEEGRLLKEIGRRLADALTTLITAAELRESENRYRRITEGLTDYQYSVRVEHGRAVETKHNPACLGVTGYTPGEFAADPYLWIRMVPPEDREAVRARAELILAGKDVAPIEHRLVRKDGARRWVSDTAILLRDRAGQLASYDGVIKDVTERKRVDDALRFVAQRGWQTGTEKFFDALAQFLCEQLEVDYALIDRVDEDPEMAETVALWAKGAIAPNLRYALRGTPCENVMGQRLCAYPRGVQALFPEDALLAEMGAESYLGLPLWDSTGRAIGLIAVMDAREMSDPASATQLLQLVATRAAAELERERSDRLLRKREHEFRTLAENLPDNIVRYDREGRTVYVNPALEQTLGATAGRMLGTRIRELNPDGGYEAFAQAVDAALASGENREIEIAVPVPGQEQIIHQIRTIVERDEHGEVSGVLAIGRDITERKRAEREILQLNRELEQRVSERTAQLEAANKELESFAYSVAHDLRAPLRSIDGFSQAVLEDYAGKLDPEGNHYLQRIRAGAQRMGQLIDDMLNLSRVTRGELRLERVDLSALAEEIASELARREPGRKVSFKAAPGLVVTGDSRFLRVALENLLGNAWKFTSKRPKAQIEFGVAPRSGQPEYFVRDNGAGFDMKYAARLFGVFQRLHTAEEFPGSGVGLATVQRIVHRHGGRVWAAGEVDNGATLFFTLPQTAMPDMEPPSKPRP